MSLLFTDGFDLDDWAGKYTGTGGGTAPTATSDGRFGSRGLAFLTNTAYMACRTFTASATVHVGVAFKYTNTTASFSTTLLSLWGDNNVTQHLYIGFTNSGAIDVRRGQWNSTVLGTSASSVLAPNTWAYVEVSATIADGTGGAVTVKVDGTAVLTLSGIDTKNGGTNVSVDTIRIGSQAIFTAGTQTYDDLYVLDSVDATATQGSPLNALLGPIKIKTLQPSGAGSTTQFTPTGSSNNWENVNDLPTADDATYNANGTTGQRDLYDVPAPGFSSATVHGIVMNSYALRDNTGAISIKPAVKSGGSVGTGTAVALSTSKTFQQGVIAVDPSTSSAFTASAIDSIEIGVEVA